MAENHEAHEVHEHEHEGHERPTWLVRLALGVGGIVLLVVALVAWQMHADFGGRAAIVLPWLVVAAILLGAAAIIESITSAVWITLIGGVFAIVVALLIAGRFSLEFDSQAHSVFVVDRLTGDVKLCSPDACRALPDSGDTPSPSISLSLPHLPFKPQAAKR